MTFYRCDRKPYISNLRRKDLFDLVISEVSSHGHLALLLLTLCIAEHKSWLGGDGGEQSGLHQDGQEAERGTHGRKVEENTLQKHAFLPSRAHFLFSTPAKMQFYYYTIKGSIH